MLMTFEHVTKAICPPGETRARGTCARDRGVSTQDIYDARSIKRRVRVSGAMLAGPSA